MDPQAAEQMMSFVSAVSSRASLRLARVFEVARTDTICSTVGWLGGSVAAVGGVTF